ncbi:MAG TPA: hypothetical protein VFA10_08575 [Ktedonobacteraceae bacterium]|nr:hypothetical protein [Ktedonobacteraceae bacterium]
MMDYRERAELLHDLLRKEGFTRAAIEHLKKLRRDYPVEEMYITSAEQQRLVFIRWLVLTGRMSEWIV